MKKIGLIPILLATTSLPLVSIIGCGKEPIDKHEIYVNVWNDKHNELISKNFNVSIDKEYDIYIDVDDFHGGNSERYCCVWTVVDDFHGDYEMLEFTHVEVDGNEIHYSPTVVETPYGSGEDDIGCLEIYNYTVNATSKLYLKAKGIKKCVGYIEFSNDE